MKKILLPVMTLTIFLFTMSMSCKKNSSDSSSTGSTATLPAVFSKFNSTVQVYVDGSYVVIKSNGIPDHKSPYFATTDSRYEAYNGTNPAFVLNPNRIAEQTLTFKI